MPVLDLLSVQGAGAGDAERASAQIVVMAPAHGARFGLMVDDLGEIAEVLTERLTPPPPWWRINRCSPTRRSRLMGMTTATSSCLWADRLCDDRLITAARSAA